MLKIMKKILVVFAGVVLTISTSAAIMGSTWVKVSDPDCNKCIMNDTQRICGKPNCKGFMAQVDGTGKYEDGYLKYNYRCKKCGHTITYKNK